MNNFNLNFVTFFGIGNIKFAPGTLASAAVCLIFYFLINYVPYSIWFLLIIFFVILIYAPIAINKTHTLFNKVSQDQMVDQEIFSNDDPKKIVIDEVLGMFIPLLLLSFAFEIESLPNFLLNICAAMWFVDDQSLITKFYLVLYYKHFIFINFLLFRFFDIFKPFPISYVDKNFKNSFGVIFDDILAGLYCVLFPFILMLLTPLFKFLGL